MGGPTELEEGQFPDSQKTFTNILKRKPFHSKKKKKKGEQRECLQYDPKDDASCHSDFPFFLKDAIILSVMRSEMMSKIALCYLFIEAQVILHTLKLKQKYPHRNWLLRLLSVS